MTNLGLQAELIAEEAKRNRELAQAENSAETQSEYVRAATQCRWIELVYRLSAVLIELASEKI